MSAPTQLEAKLGAVAPNEDWDAFAEECNAIADGNSGWLNVDEIHRQKHLAPHLDDAGRHELVLFWHRLPGWPDATPGLYGIKKHTIVGTLSNATVRTLVDMAKYADLPWDVILCSDFFSTYKPSNRKVFLGAAEHLSLLPAQLCMVAAHTDDLRAAAAHGFRTVFVPRPRERCSPSGARSKAEGGEFDLVVRSFEELARALEARRPERQQWQRQ
ncbi:hypothetical protein DAEQUDRAFT_766321 [Daedalea quercina L-15889]|uniref:HAD-like protein n=1 Tax=Daedalea quercina L-15889 TaxID=1314783 RepID=A0A165PQP0_9APHY|nr:hypothetical protein DAEQUDRAFT_766321 [Daedalea quercina L-15889]